MIPTTQNPGESGHRFRLEAATCLPINKTSDAAIMKRRIFDQERIEGVVEICLGAASPSEMDLFPLNVENRQYCATVRKKLQGD